jgi:hypothetical protein
MVLCLEEINGGHLYISHVWVKEQNEAWWWWKCESNGCEVE